MKRKKNVKWFKERPKKKKERLLFYQPLLGSAAVPVADNHHLYSSDSLTPLKSQTGVNSVDNSDGASSVNGSFRRRRRRNISSNWLITLASIHFLNLTLFIFGTRICWSHKQFCISSKSIP